MWALAVVVVVVVKPIGKISNRICVVVCIKAKKKVFFSLVRVLLLCAFHSTEIGQMFFEMKCEWFLFGRRRRRFLCLRAFQVRVQSMHHNNTPCIFTCARTIVAFVGKKIFISFHIYIIFVYAWFYAVRWWWFILARGKYDRSAQMQMPMHSPAITRNFIQNKNWCNAMTTASSATVYVYMFNMAESMWHVAVSRCFNA